MWLFFSLQRKELVSFVVISLVSFLCLMPRCYLHDHWQLIIPVFLRLPPTRSSAICCVFTSCDLGAACILLLVPYYSWLLCRSWSRLGLAEKHCHVWTVDFLCGFESCFLWPTTFCCWIYIENPLGIALWRDKMSGSKG